MSKQLTFSATLAVLSMAALAIVAQTGGMDTASAAYQTAHLPFFGFDVLY